GGDLPYLYCIDSTGELLKKVFIQAKNNDWEELVLENGTVYIGDFGNNLNGRKNLNILYFPFRWLKDSLNLTPKKISFSYPEQQSFPPEESKRYYDCEAMIVIKDSIYLFSKNRTSPFDGTVRIYSLPAKEGSFKA